MKASDISDEAFLNALNTNGKPTNLDALSERLSFPWKIVKAKAKTMIVKRKTVSGCYCGCRGDFERVEPKTTAWEEDVWTLFTSRLEKSIKDPEKVN